MRTIYLGNTLINDAFLGSDRMSDFVQEIPFDIDAQNFFTATGIENTGLQIAVTNFVLDLKRENLWNKMIQILPFVADNTASLATQFGVNLKNTNSLNPIFRSGSNSTTNLIGSDFNGFQAQKGINASNSIYINTQVFPSNFTSSAHVCIYTTDATETGDVKDWALTDDTNGSGSIMMIGDQFNGTTVRKISTLASRVDINVNEAPEAGCYISSMVVSGPPGAFIATNQYMVNNRKLGTNSVPYSRPRQGHPAYFGASNTVGTISIITARSGRKYQLLTVGTGLTESEMSTLNTIVQNFQTNIDTVMGTSRKV